MADDRKPKGAASTANNAKNAGADQRGGALRRAAKALQKASAREKKVRENVDKGNNQLDAVLMALENTDVGSAKAREAEGAARAALKDLLVQRKKLRKARKALRKAEGKEREAKDRTSAAAAKEARAAQARKVSRKPPVKQGEKSQAGARAKSAATKPSAMNTRPATEAEP